MSIDCSCEADYLGEPAWHYYPNNELSTLTTKRARRCVSCDKLIKPGEQASQLTRFRPPKNHIEEAIYGEDGEVPLASYYHCKDCTKLAEFIDGMGWCYTLGDNLEEELNNFEEK